MIDLLRREPIVKRISIYMGIGLITILFIFSINQYNNFKNIYLEQLNINKKIVGSIVSEHPELEADIVNSIYINDKDYSDLGEKVLKKYGYDKNYKMIENINFQQHIKYFLVNNLIVFVGIIILIILIMCNLMKYVFNKLDKVSKNVECIIHGKYNIKDDFKEEGIFNIIHSDLNKLSKSINIKIKNLDKEKENIKELVTDISHQLKTPVASLKLYNSLLLEEDLEEEDRTEFLKTSGMSINKLQSLVESLVNISRLETSMISIKKENKNIKATIIKAIESVKPKSINKFISINLNDFDDKIVPHDPKWTEECIFNILDNAVKYTNLKGKIDIYVQDAINFIRIDIKDNGIGIDKNEFNNIFKRFYRSEEVQDLEGSGVGLYLSRKILEIQGGNIIVSSQKGEGSKFSLFLTKV